MRKIFSRQKRGGSPGTFDANSVLGFLAFISKVNKCSLVRFKWKTKKYFDTLPSFFFSQNKIFIPPFSLSGWSKKSEETVAATERCSRTLQRIYPRASIPDSPSEPEPAPVPSGAQTVPVKIPQFLEESNDPMATQVTPMETTPTVEPSKNVEPPKIDLSSLGINMDTLRDAVSNANGGQHAPPTQPTPDNLYDAPRYSNSPPQDNRFGRVHAPTPPRPHTGPPNRSSSPSNGHRYAPYPNNRRSPPFGRPYDNRRYDDTRNRFDDRYGHGRDDRYPRDRSPVRVSDSRRHSRSPPPRYHSRSSPPRPHYRDSRVGGDRGGYRR